MKIIILNQDVEVIKSLNDPLSRGIQDFIIKPNSNVLKILYLDGRVEEYYLTSREYNVNHDLNLDIEEMIVKFYVDTSDKVKR